MILQYWPGAIEGLSSGKATVLDWVREIRTNGKLREHTQFPVGMDAVSSNKTIKEAGTLRIDRQRVISVNERVEKRTEYGFVNQGRTQTFATRELAAEAAGKKKIIEIKKEVTIADFVWTLFAVQSGKDSAAKSHNRIFVLNNHNMVNNYTADQWVAIFETSLDNESGMILTSRESLVPSGVTGATEYTPP